MKLSVSRIVGRLIGWLMILFIVLIIMPIGMISSIFSYCFPNLKKYLDVILRRVKYYLGCK
jgi:hypothetical protein